MRETLGNRAISRHPQDRKKRPASLRFSKELDELLKWEGLSAIERLAIDGFEDDDHLSDISEPSVAVRGSFEEEHHSYLRDEAPSDFTELSTMLESAKKKLEVSVDYFLDLLNTLTSILSYLKAILEAHVILSSYQVYHRQLRLRPFNLQGRRLRTLLLAVSPPTTMMTTHTLKQFVHRGLHQPPYNIYSYEGHH